MFRRRGKSDVEATVAADPVSGKGRPTPSRKEAQAARQARVKPARNSKEAKAQARAQQGEARAARRAGALAGDERHLPPRDAGPVRGFARDFIDRRRRVGELVLPVALLVIVLGFIPTMAAYTYLGFYLLLAAVVADSLVVRFQLKRELRVRFPDAATRGTTFYAIMRSLQIRRLRVPRPRVSIGQPL